VTDPDPWAWWVRVVDHHGIMHLARVDMSVGQVLCGHPPVGCTWTDEVGVVALPGDPTPAHSAVCRHCRTMIEPGVTTTSSGHPGGPTDVVVTDS